MEWYKTMIDKTLADDKLKLLELDGIGARSLLMCYLGKSPVLNYLYRTPADPYTDNEIAKLLTIELQKWLQIKEKLLKYGGFDIDKNKALGIPKWAEHQSDYYRQKKYRQGYNKGYKVVTHRSKKLEVRSYNTNKKHTLSYPFESIWNKYPNKDGRKQAERHFKLSVKTEQDWQDIQKALKNYLNSENVKKGFIKNGSTWFNNWQDWVNFTGKNYPPEPAVPVKRTLEEQAKFDAMIEKKREAALKELKK